MISYLRRIIPEKYIKRYKQIQANKLKQKVSKLPLLTEEKFRAILSHTLNIQTGDNIFVHSSVGMLNLDFSPVRVLEILLEIIGDNGTLVMPTYPKLSAYRFLQSGEVFNVRRTPTYTGLLNEYARRHKNAVRSLHPTKSVVAIGPLAETLTNEHHLSPYPYDYVSPYYKIINHNFKVIGIGVKTHFLSAVHAVDDTLRESYPVAPYHEKLFEAPCIDYSGNSVIVKTYAHNLNKMKFNLPEFFKRYCTPDICFDIEIDDMNFFKADALKLYNRLTDLSKENITIYKKKYYKK